MKTYLRLSALLALLSSLSFGDMRPAFNPGEDLLFRIRWGAVVGGYSTLTVPEVQMKDGQLAYHIVSEARSTAFVDTFYKVRDKNEAWLDMNTPRSLGYAKQLREGKYRVEESVQFDQANNRYHLTEHRLDRQTRESKEGTIPPNVFDILSSFYYVRGMALEVGKTISIDVHSGDKTWPLLVTVLKKERIKVKAGKFDTYLLEPQLREAGLFMHKGKKLQVWVTADERHMPVQMRADIVIGSITAELVKAREGLAGPQVAAQAGDAAASSSSN
jgi:hypothetical protein